MSLFQSGADAPLSYSFNTAGTPQALTSGGAALVYTVTATLITATAGPGGAPVFTMALDGATGAWTFTLLGRLDHADDGTNTENDLTIEFGGLVQATDADGDTVMATGSIIVTVDDNTPMAVPGTSTGTVDEDGLPGGIAGGIGDVAGEATCAQGSVVSLFQSGADAPLSYSFNTAGTPQALDPRAGPRWFTLLRPP